MFGKLFGFGKQQDSDTEKFIRQDPDNSLDNFEVSWNAKYLTKRNFSTFSEEFEKRTWDEKSLFLTGLAHNNLFTKTFTEWILIEPKSYIAHLFKGVNHVFCAWESRSSKLAKEVSQEQWGGFVENLQKAKYHLEESISIKPNAEAYARLIAVCMGLNDSTGELSNFEAAIKIQPDHLGAHLSYATTLTPKWGGSREKMYEFADITMSKRLNPLLNTVMLHCFVEDALDFTLKDDDSDDNFFMFFNDAKLKQDFLKIYHDFKEPKSGKELIPIIRNYFCFILLMMDEKDLAKKEVGKIFKQMTTSPWAYIGVRSNSEMRSIVREGIR
ncbi:hypothetical protein GCM10027035_46870 [Emticicia sediminis]